MREMEALANKVLRALALLRGGICICPGVFHFAENWLLDGYCSTNGGRPGSHQVWKARYRLEKGDRPRFDALLKGMASAEPRVRNATEQFFRSCNRPSPGDRAVGLTACSEVLFSEGKGTRNKREKIVGGVIKMLKDVYPPRELHSIMNQLLDLRHRVVHDGYEGESALDDAIVNAAEPVLRTALQRRILGPVQPTMVDETHHPSEVNPDGRVGI
jgi:hypothetical protein